MKRFIPALVAITCFSAHADETKPNDKEIGVIACIELNTIFDLDDASDEKAKLVNAIFQELGLGTKYDHTRHADSWNKYKLDDKAAYLQGYTTCDKHIFQVDPDGTKYRNNDD